MLASLSSMLDRLQWGHFLFFVGALGGGDGYNCQSYAPYLSWFYMFILMFKDMLWLCFVQGTHFVELCCQRKIPLLFLQNITGESLDVILGVVLCLESTLHYTGLAGNSSSYLQRAHFCVEANVSGRRMCSETLSLLSLDLPPFFRLLAHYSSPSSLTYNICCYKSSFGPG